MTIPTNQYEADEKFDIEQDKLEERIQRKMLIISSDKSMIFSAIYNFLKSEQDLAELLFPIIRWQAEQDIKNDED